MTVHWTWGLSTAVMLAIVIHLNGQGVRSGWLLGAAVQLVNLAFGWLVYGQWTFGFLAIPAALFLFNWWRHPARSAARVELASDMQISCGATKGGMTCDRAAGHDGLHVGFELTNDGKLKLTGCWSTGNTPVIRI